MLLISTFSLHSISVVGLCSETCIYSPHHVWRFNLHVFEFCFPHFLKVILALVWINRSDLIKLLVLVYRGWFSYVLPSVFVCIAVVMLWCRHLNRGKPLEPFRITPPHNNAVEQLLLLQEAITQVEALLRAGNIILLKIRALLFAVLPQVCVGVTLIHLEKDTSADVLNTCTKVDALNPFP